MCMTFLQFYITNNSSVDFQMKMKWKQTVVTCHQLWCVAHLVLVPVTCQMSFHPVHWLPSLSKVSPQLRRHHFYFLPLHLQQKISFPLLTSLHGVVKKSAVVLYSGVLMVRSLLTPSFWTLFAPVHAVHGPLWPLGMQRVYSKLVNERFSNIYSNIHLSILSTTEVFYLYSFLAFSACVIQVLASHEKSIKFKPVLCSLFLHIVYYLNFFLAFLYLSYSYTYFEFFPFERNYVYISLKKIPDYSINLYILSFLKIWLVNRMK